MVVIGRFQFGGIDARTFLRLDVAPDHNALAWAQRQAFRWAHRLAEAAFDALIHKLVGGGQGFEVLEVDLRVFAEHHVGVENAVGVEQAFELPHQLIRIAAPLQLNERRHVAAGAVFGFQRATKLHGYQLCDVVHERLIACDFFAAIEALGEHKVQIAFQGMSEKDGFIVVMFVEQRDQAVHADGQLFDREGHVFDDHRGAGFTHRANGREGVFADSPQAGIFYGVFGEVDLLFHRECGQGRHDQSQLLLQQRRRSSAGFNQQCAGIFR